jgi:hypothetical protein
MTLFITDSSEKYLRTKEQHKLLLEGTIILKSSELPENEIHLFNNNNNNIDAEAGEKMLAELYELCEKLKISEVKSNKFIEAVGSKNEKLFALLYEFFSVEIIHKYLFSVLLEKFIAVANSKNITEIQLDFENSDFSFFCPSLSSAFKGIKFISSTKKSPKKEAQKIKNVFKNLLFYTGFYAFKKVFSPSRNIVSDKKHILLVIYNIEHHFQVLKAFFDLINTNKNVHLSIVIFETKFDKSKKKSWREFKSENIDLYFFSEFRKPLYKNSNKEFLQLMANSDLNFDLSRLESGLRSAEIKYHWMDNLFTVLKPDVCFHLTTHEIGRIMANVASYHKIPSLQVDYALFSDWYTIESRIRFTVRASINEAMIELWKKRNDPTPEHYAIGFCKLDSIKIPSLSKKEFLESNNFDFDRKTIFFASTWFEKTEIYEIEKRILISMLSEICHRNKFNLIIKKHPLEKDNIAIESINANKYPFQKVFQHFELSISDAVYYSDLVTNQMSSVVLECLYFEKPFYYLTTSESSNQTETSLLKNEKFTHTFNIQEFDGFVSTIFDSGKINEFISQMKEKKERYLYKTDGKASSRLLELLMSIKFK